MFKVFGISEICYSAQKSQTKWCFLSLQEQNKHWERMSLSWKKSLHTDRGEMGKIRQKKMMGGKKLLVNRRYRTETNLLYPLLHQRGNNPAWGLPDPLQVQNEEGEKRREKERRKSREKRERHCSGTHGRDVLQGGTTDGGAWTTPGTSAISSKVLIAFSRLGIGLSR